MGMVYVVNNIYIGVAASYMTQVGPKGPPATIFGGARSAPRESSPYIMILRFVSLFVSLFVCLAIHLLRDGGMHGLQTFGTGPYRTFTH